MTKQHLLAAWLLLGLFTAVCIGFALLAAGVQTDCGAVKAENVSFKNRQGLKVRGKLYVRKELSKNTKMPGVVFIPGYQSVRETLDSFCIELSRRGFIALAIDAIGRGNSDNPKGIPGDPQFDETYGGLAAIEFLRSLNNVDRDRLGIMGHSLGGKMAYEAALKDPDIKALVIIGTAYSTDATVARPKNMMMAIGKYDEHRERMTKTDDIEAEWMRSPETLAAFGRADAKIGKTYGSFEMGTARRVIVPPVAHEMEPHNAAVIAGSIEWMVRALGNQGKGHLAPTDQVWEVKEWSTLAMMIFGFAALFPLSFLLVRVPFFSSIRRVDRGQYSCSPRDFIKPASINGLLMWLYLPSALIVFGIHKYVVRIDSAFPLMIVNAVVFWLLFSNTIGFLLLRRWAGRHPLGNKALSQDLGFSLGNSFGHFDKGLVAKTVLFSALIFGFIYALQYSLERLLIVDFRFVFAFANDLTPYRFLMFLEYLPFFALGFVLMGYFLHGQLRCAYKKTLLRTFANWSVRNLAVMTAPLLVLLMVQYVPLYTTGAIPLIGPGSMFVLLIINVFHILGVLAIVIPLSTWLYLVTNRPYAGAFLNAAIVAWMFASSQVIAPVPV